MIKVVVLSLLLSGMPASAATILILGDSLGASYGMPENQGWVEGLRQQFPQHQFVNGSVSGETTAGGLRRLPALLESSKPDILLIELGGNDGLRGFPTGQLKQNLKKIITLAQSANAEVLLTEIMVPPNYGPRYAKQFNQLYHDLAAEYQILLIPFFMQEIAPFPELMQRDGIHPNEKAQAKITQWMQPWITKALEK
ncbi:MAG: arylesterase [Shewanella sp.]